MRNRAAGIIIENGKIVLIHRIKTIDNSVRDYYVVPGGGIEKNETNEEAAIREVEEEIGIKVKLLDKKPLFTLYDGIHQYFYLTERISGVIGTGKGPEFTSDEYKDKGKYIVEEVKVEDILNNKINLVPPEIKEDFIKYINDLEIDIEKINSKDLLNK